MPPTLSGDAVEGAEFTILPGISVYDSTAGEIQDVSYQIRRDGVDIVGATSSLSYTVTPSDVGTGLTVVGSIDGAAAASDAIAIGRATSWQISVENRVATISAGRQAAPAPEVIEIGDVGGSTGYAILRAGSA